MGILACLQDERNTSIVYKTKEFFDRFIPKELLHKCGLEKAADRANKEEHCYRQISFFDSVGPPNDVGTAKVSDSEKERRNPPALGYSAESILQDKIIIGFWNESFNQTRNQRGLYGITGSYSHNAWYRFDQMHVNWERLEIETAGSIIRYFRKPAPQSV